MQRTVMSIALAGLLWGCAGQPSPLPGGPVLEPGVLKATHASSGATFRLDVGQVLLVELPERPSTGTTWQLVSGLPAGVLHPEGQRFEASPDDPDIGSQQLRFRGVGPGDVVLDLALVRPGHGLAGAADRWIVQVSVQ